MRATDLQRLLARDEVQVVPLRRGEVGLLAELHHLGPVALSTGSPGALLTTWGALGTLQRAPDGSHLLVREEGMAWLGQDGYHAVGVLGREGRAFTPRLLFFGMHGERLHQVSLTEASDLEALRSILERHQGCRHCLRHEAAPCADPVPFDCPGSVIREAWREATSNRDLDARLEGLGLGRLLLLRAMEGLHSEALDLDAFRHVLGRLAAQRLPAYLEVGQPQGRQGLRATFEEARLEGDTWALEGGVCSLRLEPTLVDSAWVHTQPWDGRVRVDCFDAQGAAVASLGCPLDACPAVLRGWEALVG